MSEPGLPDGPRVPLWPEPPDEYPPYGQVPASSGLVAGLIAQFPQYHEAAIVDVVDATNRALKLEVDGRDATGDPIGDTWAALKPITTVLGVRAPLGTWRESLNPNVDAFLVFGVTPSEIRLVGGPPAGGADMAVAYPEGPRRQAARHCLLYLTAWNEATDVLTNDRSAERSKRRATPQGLVNLNGQGKALSVSLERSVNEWGVRAHWDPAVQDVAVRHLAYSMVFGLWNREGVVLRVVDRRDFKADWDWFDADALAGTLARALVQAADPDALVGRLRTPRAFWDWAVAEATAAGCRFKSEKEVRGALKAVGVIQDGESEQGLVAGAHAWAPRLLDRARAFNWYREGD